jgi:hypothetical protein
VTLGRNPTDPAANLAVGKFHCFIKADWEKGLPMLALGGDLVLKGLAERDLGRPGEAEKQVALGDGWWDCADKQTGLAKAHMRQRAGHWYQQALPSLTGLAKVKVAKRLEGIEAPATGPGLALKGMVFALDPAGAEPFVDIVGKAKPSNQTPVQVITDGRTKAFRFNRNDIEYATTPAMDRVVAEGSVFAWVKTPGRDEPVFTRGLRMDDISLWVGADRTETIHKMLFRPYTPDSSNSAVPADEWACVGFTWKNAGKGKDVTFYLNGEKTSTVKIKDTPQEAEKVIFVGSNPPGAKEYYSGLIGLIVLCNGELSPRDVSDFYRRTAGRYRSH